MADENEPYSYARVRDLLRIVVANTKTKGSTALRLRVLEGDRADIAFIQHGDPDTEAKTRLKCYSDRFDPEDECTVGQCPDMAVVDLGGGDWAAYIVLEEMAEIYCNFVHFRGKRREGDMLDELRIMAIGDDDDDLERWVRFSALENPIADMGPAALWVVTQALKESRVGPLQYSVRKPGKMDIAAAKKHHVQLIESKSNNASKSSIGPISSDKSDSSSASTSTNEYWSSHTSHEAM